MNKIIKQKSITKCIHCDSELHGPYCSDCGKPRTLKRINHQYIISEIGSVLNFNKGILFTIRELMLRPGHSVRVFIKNDRTRLIKPIVFLLVCSVFYTIIQQTLKFEDGYISLSFEDWDDLMVGKIFHWISSNYGYANVVMAFFIAFWIKILFRKYEYNYYEIFILLCFLIGMTMLIYSLFGVVESITKYSVLQFGVNLGFIYIAWGIGQFFDKKRKINYLKGLISYFLGMITLMILALLLGLMLDWIIVK